MTERYCEAEFNYVGPTDLVPVRSPVFDGRVPQAVGSFDDCGFALLDAPSDVLDWNDLDQIETVHRPEVEDLARGFTACDAVVAYPPILRSPAAAQHADDFAPITIVHSDFTDDYRHMIVEPDRAYRAFLDPLLRREGLTTGDLDHAGRIAMTQFWRNTGPVAADDPLALCDARSVGPDRLFRTVVPDYGGERLDFETFLVEAPPTGEPDRWYTFPNLSSTEAIVIRTYDSRCQAEDRPYWTPHSAFRDPHVTPSDATRRESIEMRALCIWN